MNENTLRVAAAIAIILLTVTSAEARRHRQHQYQPTQAQGFAWGQQDPRYTMMQPQGFSWGAEYQSNVRTVPHPQGCPRRAFCGCGVSVKVFGKPIKSLFLAANWLKYPRTTPSAGMVAARRGHVMYIMAMDANGNATVYDPNSGGHKTRIHTRSLAGYVVVNPHGSQVSMM